MSERTNARTYALDVNYCYTSTEKEKKNVDKAVYRCFMMMLYIFTAFLKKIKIQIRFGDDDLRS